MKRPLFSLILSVFAFAASSKAQDLQAVDLEAAVVRFETASKKRDLQDLMAQIDDAAKIVFRQPEGDFTIDKKRYKELVAKLYESTRKFIYTQEVKSSTNDAKKSLGTVRLLCTQETDAFPSMYPARLVFCKKDGRAAIVELEFDNRG